MRALVFLCLVCVALAASDSPPRRDKPTLTKTTTMAHLQVPDVGGGRNTVRRSLTRTLSTFFGLGGGAAPQAAAGAASSSGPPASQTKKDKKRKAVKVYTRPITVDLLKKWGAAGMTEGVYTEQVTDDDGPVPPFLLALWAAIKRSGAIKREGPFRKVGQTKVINGIIAMINLHGRGNDVDDYPVGEADLAVLDTLKEWTKHQQTDASHVGLMLGAAQLTEDAKLADVVDAIQLNAQTQRAKTGRFFLHVMQKTAKHSDVNLMTASNLATVFRAFFNVDTSDKLKFISHPSVQLLELLITEYKSPYADEFA